MKPLNLSRSFDKLKIIEALKSANPSTMFGIQVQLGCEDPARHDEVIRNVKDQMRDNLPLTTRIVGVTAINLINQYYA